MGQLLTDALVIRNATQAGENTATRVGGWMEDAAIAIEEVESALNFFDFSSGANTTALQDTWTPLLLTATQGFSRNGLSLGSGGLVTYSGATQKYLQFSFIVSFIGPSQSRKYHVAMFKNGQLWPCSEFTVVTGSQQSEAAIPSQCVVPVSNGDTLQVYIKCSNNALSVTLDNANVIIKQF